MTIDVTKKELLSTQIECGNIYEHYIAYDMFSNKYVELIYFNGDLIIIRNKED